MMQTRRTLAHHLTSVSATRRVASQVLVKSIAVDPAISVST